LFSGHDESAQNHAILWSLIASAQRHEIDVQLHLRSVLAHLPGLPPEELPNYRIRPANPISAPVS
jgi:hypothetical protein